MPQKGTKGTKSTKIIDNDRSLRLGALGIRSMRKTFSNGHPVQTAYLHHLRIHPTLRGGTSLARGYRAFRKEAEKLPSGVTYTSILRENKAAVNILENASGRGPLPRYTPFCDYLTVIIPLKGFGRLPLRRRSCRDSFKKYDIRTIEKKDSSEFFSLWREFGERHFGAAFIETPNEELLPGLHITDFLGAFHGNRLVGAVGLWDQTAFKQVKLTGLGGSLEWLWKAAQLLGPVIGAPRLPSIGENIRFTYFDPWFTVPGHEKALKCLFAEAAGRLRKSGHWFAAWGTPESHPAAEIREAFFHLIYRSTIYKVAWEGDSCPNLEPGQIPFANLGFL